jgi:Domain of unknown function (DUF5047)
MRAVSAAWPLLIRHTHPMVTTVDSWLSGTLLMAKIPIQAGQIAYDDTGLLKRRLTLTVPAEIPGLRLDPGENPAAPLAAYGQRLHVYTGTQYPNGARELLDHGWYLTTGWKRDEDGGAVGIEAISLAQLIADDRLTAPSSPPAAATYVSEFTRIVAGILPVVIDPGLADRAIGTTTWVWDRDRDKALADLCAAWPARWYVGDDAAVHAAAPYPPIAGQTPVLELTDGAAGTVVGRARAAQRGALYNTVVVDGKTPDSGAAGPHAVSQNTDPASPIRADGPYGKVVRFYASDLITTQPQAHTTADTMLQTWSVAGRVEQVTCVPDPSLQLGDIVRVYTSDGDAHTGRVTAMTVPLTPDDGAMSLTIGVEPDDTEQRQA